MPLWKKNFRERITLIPPAIPQSYLTLGLSFQSHSISRLTFLLYILITHYKLLHIFTSKEKKTVDFSDKIRIFSPSHPKYKTAGNICFLLFHIQLSDASPTKSTDGTLHAYSLLALYVRCGLIFSCSTLFALFQCGQHSFAIFTNYEHESVL